MTEIGSAQAPGFSRGKQEDPAVRLESPAFRHGGEVNTLISRVRAWWKGRDQRRWLTSPAGCCDCGTGGPYYRGSDPSVTRYLYTGACGPEGPHADWSSCSRHPVPAGATLLVDYGADVVRTFAETEADAAAAWAALHPAAEPRPGPR